MSIQEYTSNPSSRHEGPVLLEQPWQTECLREIPGLTVSLPVLSREFGKGL